MSSEDWYVHEPEPPRHRWPIRPGPVESLALAAFALAVVAALLFRVGLPERAAVAKVGHLPDPSSYAQAGAETPGSEISYFNVHEAGAGDPSPFAPLTPAPGYVWRPGAPASTPRAGHPTWSAGPGATSAHSTSGRCSNAAPAGANDSDFAPPPRPTGQVNPPVLTYGSAAMQLPACYHEPMSFAFAVSSPGDVEVQFTPSIDSEYPVHPDLSQLRGCLIYEGEKTCAFAPLMAQTWFAISAQDLQNHGTYRMVLANAGPNTLGFFRVDAYWSGVNKHLRFDSVKLGPVPEGCVDPDLGDYFGCEADFRWPGGSAGQAGFNPSFLGAGKYILTMTSTDTALSSYSCTQPIANHSTYTCPVPPARPGTEWIARLRYSKGQSSGTGFDVIWP